MRDNHDYFALSPEVAGGLGDELLEFRLLHLTGVAGHDDLGITALSELVVFRRGLDLLREFHLDHCIVAPFPPGG